MQGVRCGEAATCRREVRLGSDRGGWPSTGQDAEGVWKRCFGRGQKGKGDVVRRLVMANGYLGTLGRMAAMGSSGYVPTDGEIPRFWWQYCAFRGTSRGWALQALLGRTSACRVLVEVWWGYPAVCLLLCRAESAGRWRLATVTRPAQARQMSRGVQAGMP